MKRKGWVVRISLSAALFVLLISVSTRIVGPSPSQFDSSTLSGASVEAPLATVPRSTQAEPSVRPESLSSGPVTYAVQDSIEELAPISSLNMLAALAAAVVAAAVLTNKIDERRGARRR